MPAIAKSLRTLDLFRDRDLAQAERLVVQNVSFNQLRKPSISTRVLGFEVVAILLVGKPLRQLIGAVEEMAVKREPELAFAKAVFSIEAAV